MQVDKYHGIVIFLVAFAPTVDSTTRFSCDCPEGWDFSQDDFFVATSCGYGTAAIETSLFLFKCNNINN